MGANWGVGGGGGLGVGVVVVVVVGGGGGGGGGEGGNEMGDQCDAGPMRWGSNDVHPHPHVSARSCSRCYATITNASRWVPDVFPMSFLATSAGGRRMSGRSPDEI